MTTLTTNKPLTYNSQQSGIHTYSIAESATVSADNTFLVYGRDVLSELDDLRKALLLLQRDTSMEEKYPELKQAYETYQQILDELLVAEKLTDGQNNA